MVGGGLNRAWTEGEEEEEEKGRGGIVSPFGRSTRAGRREAGFTLFSLHLALTPHIVMNQAIYFVRSFLPALLPQSLHTNTHLADGRPGRPPHS